MLGLDKEDIAERPLWVNVGTEQLIVPLTSEAAVRRVRVRARSAGAACERPGAKHGLRVRARRLGAAGALLLPARARASLEDPATGSATANLGGWCLAMGRTLPCEFEIAQGEFVGRPSSLRLRVDAERQIHVSGEVIELGRGSVNL